MRGPAEITLDTTAPARWVERWWAGDAGWGGQLLSLALAPVEAVFRGAVRLRGAGYDWKILPATRVAVPVISVGNISVGGAGKTPVARWLVTELERRGHSPAVLHGGYALDEPALHRLWHPDIPVIVGRDRVASAGQAIEGGASVLVLDDGFQHRRLARDVDLVLVAAENWGARRRLLPRGPWRESARALARAQAIVVTRKLASKKAAWELLHSLRSHAPRAAALQLWLRPAGWLRYEHDGPCDSHHLDSPIRAPRSGESPVPHSSRLSAGTLRAVEGGPRGEVLAVTAIARPELFVGNAREAGALIVDTLCFPDHHEFTTRDLVEIRRKAAGRPVVTTAKDLVKLGPVAPDLELWILEQEVVVEEGAAALDTLLAGLDSRSDSGGS